MNNKDTKETTPIRIIIQAFYGNRTMTWIHPEQMDRIILGILTDQYVLKDEEIDRSIIHIPGSDHLVLVYNKYQEERELEYKEEVFQKSGYVMKPLASIPELDIELYSRCLMCRMNADGEFKNIQEEDKDMVLKYLAR